MRLSVSVMVRGLLETILSPQKLDELFEKSSKTQYTKELLFSTVVEMINTVACGIRPSIHAADQSQSSKMRVSVTTCGQLCAFVFITSSMGWKLMSVRTW